MMSAENIFSQAVARVFDEIPSPVAESFARSGSYRLWLNFSSRSIAHAFLPSFIPGPRGNADLAIIFATAKEIDLSHLIPNPRGEYRLLQHREYYALWHPGQLPVLYVLDRRSNRAVVWLSEGAAPAWLLSRPALPIMHAFAVDTPWIGAHGGAIGRAGRFLLLAGRGHVGKTTATLACARAGWDYAGDDYVFANSASGRIEPLYSSARLRIDMAHEFPDFLHTSAALSEDEGELRHELRLADHLSDDRIRGGALAAILLPRRRGATLPEFAVARHFDALTALLKVTLTQLPGWPKTIGDKLAALVGLAPTFFVDTGQSPAAIPEAFDAFLKRL
jgi:hypothetical protein